MNYRKCDGAVMGPAASTCNYTRWMSHLMDWIGSSVRLLRRKRISEELGGTGRNWEELGGTGRNSEELGVRERESGNAAGADTFPAWATGVAPLNFSNRSNPMKLKVRSVSIPSGTIDGHIFNKVLVSEYSTDGRLAWKRRLIAPHCPIGSLTDSQEKSDPLPLIDISIPFRFNFD